MSFADKTVDLVERLRDCADLDAAEGGEPGVVAMTREAADMIERLRAEVEMLREDAERLEYLMRHLPEDALRYVAGELADSGDIAEFRAAIDKVMAPNVRANLRAACGPSS